MFECQIYSKLLLQFIFKSQLIMSFINQALQNVQLIETHAKTLVQKSKAPAGTALSAAVTRIRTWVTSATTKGTNHYTITAM